MVSLSEMLRKYVVNVYYNIVEILVLSLIFLAMMMPCALFRYLPFQGVYFVFLIFPAFVGGMYALNNKIVSGYKIYYKDVFVGMKKYYKKSIQLALVLAFFTMTIFPSFKYVKKVKNLFSYTSFVLQIFVFVMVLLVLMYSIPFIIKKDFELLMALKAGLKLLSDNIIYSFCAFVQIACICIILSLTLVGIPIVFAGLLSMFLLENYNNVIKKYME